MEEEMKETHQTVHESEDTGMNEAEDKQGATSLLLYRGQALFSIDTNAPFCPIR